MGVMLYSPKFEPLDSGIIIPGGKLYAYAAGTDTPIDTFADSLLTVPNPNPVILDGAGRAAVYVSPVSYKFVLRRADNSLVWMQDHWLAAGAITLLQVPLAGPHVIGGSTPESEAQLRITGAFVGTGAGGAIKGVFLDSTITGGLNKHISGLMTYMTLVTHTSGTHPEITGAQFYRPTITAMGATITRASNVRIHEAPQEAQINHALLITVGTAGVPFSHPYNQTLSETPHGLSRIELNETNTVTDPGAGFSTLTLRTVQQGGTGSRHALFVVQEVTGTPTRTSTTYTGAAVFSTMTNSAAAGGVYYSINPIVQFLTGVPTSASMYVVEINTRTLVNITDKVALQIVDLADSTGVVSGKNIALRFVNQASAYGFADGILFDNVPQQSVRSTGNLVRAVGGSYATGIDFGACTFTGGGIILPNTTYYAARNASGTPVGLINIDANNLVNVGGGYGGYFSAIKGVASGSLPAAGASMNGLIGIDTTNHRLVFYEGGARYYINGTSF